LSYQRGSVSYPLVPLGFRRFTLEGRPGVVLEFEGPSKKPAVAFNVRSCGSVLRAISNTIGQTISTIIPKKVDPSKKYLFYLHGGVVQEYGVYAVSKDYGAYEYLKILDTLSSYGYIVISERRPKGTDEVEYAEKVSKQVDTLLKGGVAPENIIVVGASQGAYITIEAANMLKNQQIKYAVLAVCNEYNVNYYSKYNKELCGNFLSIYESSDHKGSCNKLLMEQHCKSGYEEVRLDMGNGHGFIFRPYQEWVHPLVKWINGG